MTGLTRTKRGTALVGVLVLIGGLLGAIAVEGPAFAAKVPGPPTNVTAQAGPAVGVMTLSYGVPTNLAAGAKITYLVSVAPDNGAFGTPYSIGTAKKATVACNAVVKCSFRVYASTKGGGTGAASATVTQPFTAPSAPTVASGVGGPAVGAMTVRVTPPANTGGKAVSAYLYDYQVNSAGPWIGPFTIAGTPATPAFACPSTLSTGGCNYRVYARNSIGTSAASPPSAIQWSLPSAPVINSVTPGRPAHAVTINWRPGTTTGGLTNTYTYEVSADAGPFVAGTGPLPAFPTVATVDCNATTICSYRLKATNSLGSSGVSNTMSTGFNVPTASRSVTARVSSLNLGSGGPTVHVTWTAPLNLGGTPVTRYEGRRCNGNCDETNSAWTSASVEALGTTGSWSTTCAADLVTCSYEVRAVNGIGPGPWGSSARIAPFAPTNVVATTAAPAGSVTVSWTGPAESGQGLDHYALYDCVTSTGCTSSAHWQDTGLSIPATATSVVHSCGNGIDCTYKLVAVEKNSGASGASSAAAHAAGSTPAGAPQSLTAASGTSIGAVNLAWTAPSNAGTFPVTGYVFERSVNGGPFSAPISTGSTATSYVDPACGASNFCTYQVAAVTLAGTGAYSNPATAEGANVPSAPQTLAATPGGTFGAVDLTWQPPLDNGGWPVTGYFVERSLDGGATWPQSWTLGTSPSYTDTTCGAGVTCTYRVSAINARGTGPVSNTSSAIGTNLSPPLNLTANTSTSTLGGVVLAWDPPATDSGFPIQGYEFRYKVGAGAFGAWADTGTLTGPRTFTHLCGQDNTCTYEVRAYNAIGTSGPSNDAPAAGLTDHTAPTVTITSPTNNQNVTTATPTIMGTNGNALGDSTTINVTIKQGATIVQTLASTGGGTAWSVTPTALADGLYTVTATQGDWAGNTGISATITFRIDTVAPTLTVTGPTASALYTSSGTAYGESIWAGCTSSNTICGTASDSGSGVTAAGVQVSVRQASSGNYWNGSSFGSASEVLTSATGVATWNLAFPASNFPAGGTYTVRAVVTDNAGFATTISRTFNVDYDPATTVFVATTGNDSPNTGTTPGSPLLTIAKGIQVAQTTGRTRVVVGSGTYDATTIQGPGFGTKTITGGYSSTFLRAAPGSGTTTVSGVGTAVLVDNYTETFQQLTFTGTNSGIVAPTSIYGLRVINNATVTLQRVTVSSASAPAGVAGSDVSGNAGNGSNGITVTASAGNGAGNNGGGAGGAGVSARNGGKGGDGGAQGNHPGNVGTAGVVSGSGGGAGGTAGGGTSDTTCGSDAGAGGAGGPGAGGTSPTGGSAGSLPINVDGDTFPGGTAATPGTIGLEGHGGGGGGGGGGEHNTFCTDDHGGGGGGGGGAGGHGNGGTNGTNGGSSFAIYVHNASVVIDANTTATAGAAGAGGRGGNGSAGGTGGQAGKGGPCDTSNEGGGGGTGGGGGGGSGGSGGGGGAGGFSIAAFHKGTGSMAVSGTTVKGTLGAAGAGGTGGGGGAGGPAQASGGPGTSGCNSGAAGLAGATGATGGAGGTGAAGSAFRIWDNAVTTS